MLGSPWCNSPWAVFLSACLIAAATLAAFSNSFGGEFVFDNRSAIIENPTIRHLWPLWTPLGPPNSGASSPAGRC